MSPDKTQGSLYRYDPDGSLQVMETGLMISNGLG
jgi:sugar lactone lactonase YvrE